ncbi:hypothetical protein [Pseudomonas aeruginosa]|uniref:hypothetical protein n=1 Tax=Pseudomonas aeruginosa TaxID=287 RepID=UPI003CC53ED4
MTESKICTCPSGDGSLRWPCPAHPAVDQADVAAKLTFINGRPAMCGCQVEYSDGGGEYSDVIYVTLCAKHSGSAILDLVATNRIALTPEYEGQWHADLYLDREIPLAKVEGATPAEAVLALMSAERIDPEQESGEQAGGDERAEFERAFTVQEGVCFDDKRGEYRSMNLREIEVTDAQDLNLRLQGWQARAALAQPSPDAPYADGIAADLERSDWTPEDALRWYAAGKHFDTVNGRTRIIDTGAVASNALKHLSLPYLEMKGDAELTELREAMAQPSPAQAEQAEAERPEVAEVAFVLRNIGAMDAEDIDGDNVDLRFEDAEGRDTGCDVSIVEYAEKAADLLEQHDRIVGELRAEIAMLRSYEAEWELLLNEHEQQRDAALARVAELERQEPVATVAKVPGEDWNSLDFHRDLQHMQPGTKLYAAPVARAQHSVPEGWVQSLPLKDYQPCKPNEDRANGYVIPIYSRPVPVEEALRKLRAVLCDPVGNVVIDGSDDDREEVQRALGMLAAAPGKEVGHE